MGTVEIDSAITEASSINESCNEGNWPFAMNVSLPERRTRRGLITTIDCIRGFEKRTDLPNDGRAYNPAQLNEGARQRFSRQLSQATMRSFHFDKDRPLFFQKASWQVFLIPFVLVNSSFRTEL